MNARTETRARQYMRHAMRAALKRNQNAANVWMTIEDSGAHLLKSWRRSLARYDVQIEEARAAGSPCEQMIGKRDALRDCARELEMILARRPDPPRE